MQPADEEMREHNAQAPHKPARRRAPLPVIFPDDLPVSGAREEIARAIESRQVVIVSGETGSGKTTQLPKICLALGRGNDGLIGHTQPRRIAASSIARRIAHEPVARRVKSSATRCGSPITLGQALRSS